MARAPEIKRIERARRRREAAREEWEAAIRDAVAGGISKRQAGVAAGISHIHVGRIIETIYEPPGHGTRKEGAET